MRLTLPGGGDFRGPPVCRALLGDHDEDLTTGAPLCDLDEAPGCRHPQLPDRRPTN
ncbi:hypothetical protein [Streptomyces sp. NBC_01451]|uniref:hypothetical protein n=1 Tax=Streptomyces sp. NBC_01451 TaxID=2903872 RepID=UPI002E31CA60|nr:hypothetical protein [Streptomyces sp. NBC_01451]